jgi:hypothetical protein
MNSKYSYSTGTKGTAWNGKETPFTTLSSGYCAYQDTSTLECPCEPKNFISDGIVGYDYTYADDPGIKFLFSRENLDELSRAVTTALRGTDPQGRDIVVAPERINEVLSSVFMNSTRPQIGSIYSRYTVPDCYPRNDLRNYNMQTLNIIVSAIKDEYDTIASNKKLTVWTTLLGDFNTNGLRAHPPLNKIRQKMPQRMMFNMNY